jgi:antibiotic biosynthesis monooxygenase (ABM) superfamily enzyme
VHIERRQELVIMNTQHTTIEENTGLVTLINVITVKPRMQAAFLDVQKKEFARLAGKIPGSVTANLHRSLDGTRVVNYAQFTSAAAFEAWKNSPEFAEHVAIIRPYVEGSAAALYEVSMVQVERSFA